MGNGKSPKRLAQSRIAKVHKSCKMATISFQRQPTIPLPLTRVMQVMKCTGTIPPRASKMGYGKYSRRIAQSRNQPIFVPDCQDPPVLQDGFHSATTTTYNSTVIYSCNPGYRMFGESSITCLDTGNWSQLLVNCTIKDCGTPPALTNGDRTFDNTTVNSTAEDTCKPGYDLIGMRTISCSDTGIWNALAANCTIKNCRDPPVLQNGYHNATSTTYNSTAIYSCNQGYRMFGENSITCLDTGNWSKLLVNCTIKDCGAPPELTNGDRTFHNTTANSTVQYTCNPGYDLIGMSTISCLESGTWNSLEANCTIKNCQDPPVLQDGFHAATITTYTSTVKYSCNPGYTMFGENSITCLDTGNWSKLLVNCTIKVLQDGFHNATSTTYNSIVKYSCNPGYSMFGANSITCLDTGYWSALLVNCTIKDCGTPPMLTNGDRTFLNTTVNSTIEYTCNPGYDFIGISNIHCMGTGTWSILEAKCSIKDCHSPPALKNGFATVSTTTYNSTAIYTCSSGYDMHGPYSIACLATGDWDKLEANCNIKDCGTPPLLTNGAGAFINTTVNNTAMYTCYPGYDFIGMRNIRCLENGTWGALEAQCTIKDCQNPPVLQNGFHAATTSTYNSTLMYSCDPGYTMLGENSITCLDTGNWSKLLVNCTIKDCQNPPVLHYGFHAATTTTYNSTVIYKCKPGYRMFGENSITCLDTGNWSELLVNCTIKDCGTPPMLNNGDRTFLITTVNSTIEYTCNPGYDLNGLSNIHCMGTGTWSILEASCTMKDCGTPPLLTNGAGAFINTTVNNTAMYTCNPGYDLIGMRNIRCLENGTWGALEAQCTIKDCQNPPLLQNGFHAATTSTYNSTLMYSCDPGYTMLGENSITCLDTGNWSKLLVNCTIKDCQNPPVLHYGFHAATTTTYNSTVIYKCKPGYRMFGENSITCLDTGNWSELLVNCTIKDCGTPPMLNNGDRTFLITTVNSTIEYTCNPGYDLNGLSNIHCMGTGTWSILEASCTMKGET
ncbi:hypothetical protein DPMN_050305 [Dreissena polymorpha]|uniref:Sushi domain-containing protein n=1 Tax=Dreissena polymorpha TaxID=45954 RepID=A0A9D4CFV2_DREPO|nr:hypothetical protein DPMN_050305 [Dreissena polymorpha]